MFKNRPPEGFLGHFLFHSGSFLAVSFNGFVEIVWECQNLKKIGKKKIAKFQNLGLVKGQ